MIFNVRRPTWSFLPHCYIYCYGTTLISFCQSSPCWVMSCFHNPPDSDIDYIVSYCFWGPADHARRPNQDHIDYMICNVRTSDHSCACVYMIYNVRTSDHSCACVYMICNVRTSYHSCACVYMICNGRTSDHSCACVYTICNGRTSDHSCACVYMICNGRTSDHSCACVYTRGLGTPTSSHHNTDSEKLKMCCRSSWLGPNLGSWNLPVCLSVGLSVCLSDCLSIGLSVCLAGCPSVNVYHCMSCCFHGWTWF